MKAIFHSLKVHVMILVGILFAVLLVLSYSVNAYLLSVTQDNITQSSEKLLVLYVEDMYR